MIDFLRPDDVVVVWKLDRLSRSLKDLLHIMDLIHARGGGFRSLTESIDTTTPAGRMLMQLLGSFAEYEREIVRERTRAGLEAARRRGMILGRPRKLNDEQRREIVQMVSSGRKIAAEAARLFRVSSATVSRIVTTARQFRPADEADLGTQRAAEGNRGEPTVSPFWDPFEIFQKSTLYAKHAGCRGIDEKGNVIGTTRRMTANRTIPGTFTRTFDFWPDFRQEKPLRGAPPIRGSIFSPITFTDPPEGVFNGPWRSEKPR
jgi:transposase-like protein